MTVALSTLRVTADFDASGYTRGMQAKVTADKAGVDSSRQMGQALAAQDAQLDNMGRGVTQLSQKYIAGYREARNFEAGLRGLNTALDRGSIDAQRASAIYAGLAQKYNMVGDAARLAAAGQTSLSRVVADSNVHLGRHVAANTNVARAARLSTMQISQMGFQLQDLGVQIASGGGILLPLVQQGSQVATVLGMGPGGLRGGIEALKGSLAAIPAGAKIALGTAGLTGIAILATKAVLDLSGAVAKIVDEKSFEEALNRRKVAADRFIDAAAEWTGLAPTYISNSNLVTDAWNSMAAAIERTNAAQQRANAGMREPLATTPRTPAPTGGMGGSRLMNPELYSRARAIEQADARAARFDDRLERGSTVGDSRTELTRMALDPMRRTLDRLSQEINQSGDYTQDMLGVQGRVEEAVREQSGFAREGIRHQESTASGIVRVYDAAQLGVGATREGARAVEGSVDSAAHRIVHSVDGVAIAVRSLGGGGRGGGGGGGGGSAGDGGGGGGESGADLARMGAENDAARNARIDAATTAGREAAERAWAAGFSSPGFSTNLIAQALPAGFVFSANRSGGGQINLSSETYINAIQEELAYFNRTGRNAWEAGSGGSFGGVGSTAGAVATGGFSTASAASPLVASAADTVAAQAAVDQAAADRATAEQNARDRSLAELRNPDPYRSLAPDYFYDPSTSAVYREGQAMLTEVADAASNQVAAVNKGNAILGAILETLKAGGSGLRPTPVEMPIPRALVGFVSQTQKARNGVAALLPGLQVMDVDAVTLPEAVERGMVAGIAHLTFSQEGSSGHDVRTRVWSFPLMEFTCAVPLQNTGGNVDTVMRLHRVNGPNIGFYFTDATDYRNNTAGGVGTVETIDSITRLVKTYNTGARSLVRKITRPNGSISLAGGGTVAPTTGIVTGGTPGTGWTGSFFVPVHFVEDRLQVQIIRRVNAAGTVLGIAQIPNFTLREIPE